MKKFTSVLAIASLALGAYAQDLVVANTYTFDKPVSLGTDPEVPSSLFADATLNSVIRVNFEEANAEGQVSIVCKVGSSWDWTKMLDWTDAPLKYFDADITGGIGNKGDKYDAATVLATMKERGIILQGKNHNVVSVQIMEEAGNVVTYEPVATFAETQEVATWDSKEVEVPASYFAKVAEDSKIEVHYTPASGAQIQVAVKIDGSEWTEVVKYADLPSTGVYTIKVAEVSSLNSAITPTAFMTALVKAGIYFKGHDYTFNKCVLLNPAGTDGINEVEAAAAEIDFNAPMEVFNLQGIRVNEMTQGNLYIVRQGNVVKKIVK